MIDQAAPAASALRIPFRPVYLFLGLAIVASLALFLGLSALESGPGFPLDDAWIHQTYARNLAREGRWAYGAEASSAGSTAPLWTLLLATGYLVGAPYLWWSYLLGGLSLFGLALSAMAAWRRICPERAEKEWLAGLTLIATWQLLWAAASGMEILLFAALAMTLIALYYSDSGKSAWLLGLLAGLLVLTRPDGLLLAALVAAGLFLRSQRNGRTRRSSLATPAAFLLAALALLVPYFAFNYLAGGAIWPSTMAAKQIEYGAARATFLPLRFLQLLYFSLGGPESGWRGISGAHWLLIPGVIAAASAAVRVDWKQRRLWYILPLLWAVGHVALYAWRLPVTYQHGRYLMVTLPIWLLYGLAGWQMLFSSTGFPSTRLRRLSRLTAQGSFATVLLLFLLLGGQQYAADVALIEGEMVTVAQWLERNTPADALIASHDIGAIGYFARRPLLDLAGLITPEVIPLLDDQSALSAYVGASDADYLVTAPGWPYSSLTDGRQPLFVTNYRATIEHGLNNMAVYQLPAGQP